MAAPTRFTSGLQVESLGTPLQNFPLPNPNFVPTYSNDFFTYAAGDWTVNAGGAGSGNALAAGTGGQLVLTAATSGTQSIIGLGAFAFQAATSSAKGNQVWFDCDIVMDATVANPDYGVGLMKGTVTTLNNVTDGVYFTKATGASVWSLVIKSAAGSTSTFALPSSTLPVNSAEVGLSFWYDAKPAPTLWVYFNETLVGTVCNETIPGSVGSLGTRGANNLVNLPGSTVYLAPAFQNVFHTGTSTLTVDYVLAACEMTRN